jgi:hypothetical protein
MSIPLFLPSATNLPREHLHELYNGFERVSNSATQNLPNCRGAHSECNACRALAEGPDEGDDADRAGVSSEAW